MQKSSEIGKKAEQMAEAYVLAKNYTILYNNWRFGHSEIDLIALDNSTIVFIEVKFRNKSNFGYPETFVNKNKILKMKQAAEAYIIEYDWKGELRYDIIAIENDTITHFEDAFY